MILNATAVISFADGEETSVSDTPDASGDALSVLTDNQQIIFLLSMVCGMLIALSFNFWKW